MAQSLSGKMIGSMLMILGTSIGAGMLALPVVNASAPITISLLELLAAWLLMTFGAMALLEVSINLPKGRNMATMTQLTLGHPGQATTWVLYLFLLYMLLCAYTAAISGVLDGLFSFAGLSTPHWVNTLAAVGLLGAVVAGGIQRIDWLNRGLMSTKLLALLLLCVVMAPFISEGRWALTENSVDFNLNALFVMITAFGYAIIIPSLRVYFDEQANALKTVVFVSSLIPLALYGIWIILIQSVLPLHGAWGLATIKASGHSVSLLMQALDQKLPYTFMRSVAQLFISISAFTSFLGVSLSLKDFVADGLGLLKKGWHQCLLMVLTLLPPVIITLFWPEVFITALNYAGLLCVGLLILMPTLMAYRARYPLGITQHIIIPGGRLAYGLAAFAGVGLVMIGIFYSH